MTALLVAGAFLIGLVLGAVGLHQRARRRQRVDSGSTDRYRALVEQGVDKFSVIDADGMVVYVSPGAERVYGVPADNLLGPFRLDDLVHPDDRQEVLEALAKVKRVPVEPVRVETRVLHRDGGWRTVASTYVNCLGDPAIGGIVCSEVDITAGRAARDALAREATFNALALELMASSTSMGLRELIANTSDVMARLAAVFEADVIWIEAQLWRAGDARRVGWVTGSPLDERVGSEARPSPYADLEMRGEQDQPEALARFGVRHSLVAPAHDGAESLGQIVVARTSGSPFDEVSQRHAAVVAKLAGQRLGRAKADMERATADQRAQLLAAHVHEAVFTVDINGRLTWASPATTRAAGMPLNVLASASLTEFIFEDDIGQIFERASAVMRGAVATAIPARLKAVDGSLRWAEIDIDVHTRAADGRVREFVVVVRDVHEHHMRAERLSAAALTDALTGVVNRSGLLSELRRLTETVGRGFAVAFCDLDGFKLVNDRYGHSAGDEALRVVADRLRAALRPADIVARFGGDEFVLVLHEVDAAVARQVCGRVIVSIAEPMVVEAGPVSVTASVGVVLADAGVEPLRLIAMADDAMYAAKRAGKNRLVLTTCSAGGPGTSS